jgi:hypothetical protein
MESNFENRSKEGFWWNIWKEQNKRTFQHEEKQLGEVAFLIKDDIQQYQLAKAQDQNV